MALIVFTMALSLSPASVLAADEAAKYWFNPSLSSELDKDTGIELESFPNAEVYTNEHLGWKYGSRILLSDVRTDGSPRHYPQALIAA